MYSGDEQALKPAWDEFTKEPMRDEAMSRLQSVSSKMKCWQEYYQKALDFLAELDKKDGKQKHLFYYSDIIRERRVQVLFAHGDQEAAWELAQGSRLSETCWLKLAEWRSKDKPHDAVSVVKNLLADALRPTGEDAYRQVVQLLKIYRNYLKMASQEAVFTAYCANLRVEYKRRRLLMELMELMDAAKRRRMIAQKAAMRKKRPKFDAFCHPWIYIYTLLGVKCSRGALNCILWHFRPKKIRNLPKIC